MPRLLRHPSDQSRSGPVGPRLRLHLPHAGESRPFSVRLPGQAYPLPSQKTPVQQSQLLEQLLLGFPTTCCKAPPCGAACRAVGATLCNTWCWQTRAHLCTQTQQRRRERSRRLLRMGCKGEGWTGATSQTTPFSAEQSSQLLPPLVPWHYTAPRPPTPVPPPALSPGGTGQREQRRTRPCRLRYTDGI